MSDSEEESKLVRTINYFDLSSSSTESDEDEDDQENYFHRFVKPEEFLECNRNDDEDDHIIPLETEDCDFSNVDVDAYGQMSCPICLIVFKSKIRFVIHRRRHFALDHFICPVCQIGFTKLEQCQAHELKEHKNTQDDENVDSNVPRYFFRTRNARKSTNCADEFQVDEEDLITIAPSTCLYPYDGPMINDAYQCYKIEVKYGRSERKSHSRIQSKYALECLKRNQTSLETKLALAQARQDKQKRLERRRQNELQVKEIELVTISNEESTTSRVQRSAIARVAIAPRRHALTAQDEDDGTKNRQCYFCSLCGFTGDDKEDVEYHREEVHPEVSGSRPPKLLKVKSKRKTKSTEYRKRLRERLTPAQIARAKKVEKKEKLKEARLFRDRRHIPRIWEKESTKPTLDEFAFAIGLKRNVDVQLGPRGPDNSRITSGLLRSLKSEVNLTPVGNKRVRIVMNRMSPTENSRFYCCPHCEYYAAFKSDIRIHRRDVHLKSLRRVKDSKEAETWNKVPEESNERWTRRKKVAGVSTGPGRNSSFPTELHVQLDDISLNIETMSRALDQAESTPGQPRKKFRVN